MPHLRPYVPSQLLLRSLLRPLPPQCSLVRRLPPSTTTTRLKSKATKKRLAIERAKQQGTADSPKPQREPKDPSSIPLFTPNTEGLGGSGVSSIEWWEQDETGQQTFVSAIRNQKDLKEHEDLHKRLEAWSRGEVDQNEPEFRAKVIDELKRNPSFAHMQDTLDAMKIPLEERLAKEAEAMKEMEEQDGEMMNMEEAIQEMAQIMQILIEEPEMEPHKQLLQEIQTKLPSWNDFSHPEFQSAMARLNQAMGGTSPQEFQSKLDSYLSKRHELDSAMPPDFDPNNPASMSALKSQITEMHDLLKETGLNPTLEQEFFRMKQDLSLENDWATDVFAQDGEIDHEKLDAAISKFEEWKEKQMELQKQEAKDENDETEEIDPITEEEKADPELKAKIDAILQDPNLWKKLSMAKKLMSGHYNTLMVTPKSAPDPETLPESSKTSLRAQLLAVQNSPEHKQALQRLKINLLPPYNTHPFVLHLNHALQLAYIGANDDVRRILWRAYLKAKTVPGLLKAVPDDAWDLLWYSQAVRWKGNQNRGRHLGVLLADLERVGRRGPPTKAEGTEGLMGLEGLEMFHSGEGGVGEEKV